MRFLKSLLLATFLLPNVSFAAKSISVEEGQKLKIKNRCDIYLSFAAYGGHQGFDLKGKVLARISKVPKVSIREYLTWTEGRGKKQAYCLILVDNPKTNVIFRDLKKIIPQTYKNGAVVLQTNTGKSWRTKMP